MLHTLDTFSAYHYSLYSNPPHVTQSYAQARGKPVVWTGDLNVAHRSVDLHNPDAKHIPKTSGCTERERASFSETLAAGPFVDAFRAQVSKGAMRTRLRSKPTATR